MCDCITETGGFNTELDQFLKVILHNLVEVEVTSSKAHQATDSGDVNAAICHPAVKFAVGLAR